MEEKKHIDRLFQEKLKDFEMNPDASIWTNIENQLVKKRKKRVLPLWLRIGGVAATLLLLISSGIWFFNSSDNEDTIKEQIIAPIIITDTKKEDILKNGDNNNSTDQTLETVVESKTEGETKEATTTTTENRSSIAIQQNNTTSPIKNIAQGSTIKNSNNNSKNKSIESTSNIISKTDNPQLSIDKIKFSNEGLQPKEGEAIASNKTPAILEENKQDLGEIVESDENTITLKEEEDSKKKWSVGSAVAPVYFSSLRSGSPIDVSLATNEKSSDISMSYGLKVNYKINDKLSLQSGISSVELGYQTKNVSALITSSEALTNSTNIDTNVKGFEIITMSNDNIAVQSQELTAPQQRGLTSLNGDLNQFMNYLEIPTEVKYTMIQKKAGLHVIGGVSTYILYKNGVTLSNFDGTVALGEASNLNELNFSGNIGLDFDYELNKKLYINVSPMFKYQFNTFSKSAGGFQPYSLGIYTGLNFRF